MAIGQTFKGYKDSLQPTDIASEVALSARLFGTWTFLAGIVRLYTACRIDNRELYLLTMGTYGIVIAHYVAE